MLDYYLHSNARKIIITFTQYQFSTEKRTRDRLRPANAWNSISLINYCHHHNASKGMTNERAILGDCYSTMYWFAFPTIAPFLINWTIIGSIYLLIVVYCTKLKCKCNNCIVDNRWRQTSISNKTGMIQSQPSIGEIGEAVIAELYRLWYLNEIRAQIQSTVTGENKNNGQTALTFWSINAPLVDAARMSSTIIIAWLILMLWTILRLLVASAIQLDQTCTNVLLFEHKNVCEYYLCSFPRFFSSRPSSVEFVLMRF